jgi:ABC-2 type transport system permease protein
VGLNFLVFGFYSAVLAHYADGAWRKWRSFYATINISFSVAESAGRGFDIFARIVKNGDFDRLLLRPRSTALQVAALELQLMRMGRFSQGLFVLIWSGMELNVEWTVYKLGLILFAVFSGACLFTGLLIVQAIIAFWTIESLEIINTVTYGGIQTAQYPLVIYQKWFRKFFTYIVPLASVNYFPALAIIGKPDPLGSPLWFQWTCPMIGVLFLCVCLWAWRFGVKHYRSTGS